MKTSSKFILASALALGLAGAGAGAIADGGQSDGEGFGRHHMCDRDGGQKIDMMAAYLESRLELTEEQMPAWNTALASVEDATAARQQACEEMKEEGRPQTALEALDRAEQRMSQGLEHIQAIRAAVTDLYAVLDDTQKATFDEVVADMRHMRG